MASNSIVEEPECRDSIIDIPHNLPPAYWPECCIFRVPKKLRKVNEEAYTPKLVSIGPFHDHGREEFREMEMHKQRYFKDFLKRTVRRQEELLKIIKDNEDTIRLCYSETFEYSSKEFVNMILLDAIFIIELFIKFKDADIKGAERKGTEAEPKKTNCLRSLLPARKEEKEAEEEREAEAKRIKCLRSLLPSLKEKEEEAEEEKYYILRKPWLDIGIYYDLILLENQLPFFVLEKLYMFAFNIDSSSCNHREDSKPIEEHKKDLEKEDAPFVILSRNYFKGYDNQPLSIKIGNEVKHFTDFIRYLFCSVPKLIQKSSPRKYLDNLYSATKLEYAGLKFKAVEERPLLDITFSKNEFLGYFPCFNLSWLLSFLPCLKRFPSLNGMQCILEVPTLTIYAGMEAVFLNLIALEQCHYPFKNYICNYVVLMNYLINTTQDVDLLVERKVIVNYMGSNAVVATLFNKLGIQIWEGPSCYHDLRQALKNHYEHPWNHTLAVLRNMYFGDFGRGIATVAALLTLVGLFVPFVTDIGSKRN